MRPYFPNPQLKQKVLDVALAVLFFALVILVLPRCNYYEAKAGHQQDINLPTKGLTFADIDKAVIQPHCASCHNAFEPLDYSGVMNYVTAGDHKASRFWEVLDTGYMPKKRPKLDPSLINAVANWIDDGAEQ